MDDKRKQKTRKNIETTFIEILEKRKVNTITVAEIVRKSNISRSTFYLHYDDIYDLYDEVRLGFLNCLLDNLNNYYPYNRATSYLELIQNLIFFVEKNQQLFLIFIKEDGSATFDKLTTILVEKIIEFEKIDSTDLQGYYEISWSVRGTLGIIVSWVQNGMQPPKKEFIEIIRSILDKL
ncbi:TetR/AcrR family transcriptional regulator [Lactobacillus sp. UCMA15818]|uniref:TetR/AcrR family transcriptional regulator n=3 Tax=Lactobacillaceae TaxID=33958 RepID=UPI0025AF65F6|nr:TetR/AcrR family transcriptional regulator [Lactobacillus sp. UCMA15818]